VLNKQVIPPGCIHAMTDLLNAWSLNPVVQHFSDHFRDKRVNSLVSSVAGFEEKSTQ
jgi:hypothetical protein